MPMRLFTSGAIAWLGLGCIDVNTIPTPESRAGVLDWGAPRPGRAALVVGSGAYLAWHKRKTRTTAVTIAPAYAGLSIQGSF